jgi:hypothetical protein
MGISSESLGIALAEELRRQSERDGDAYALTPEDQKPIEEVLIFC